MKTSLLLVALSLGCVKYTSMGESWTALQSDSRVAAQDEYAKECAAEEYGLAQAHEAFARI